MFTTGVLCTVCGAQVLCIVTCISDVSLTVVLNKNKTTMLNDDCYRQAYVWIEFCLLTTANLTTYWEIFPCFKNTWNYTCIWEFLWSWNISFDDAYQFETIVSHVFSIFVMHKSIENSLMGVYHQKHFWNLNITELMSFGFRLPDSAGHPTRDSI